MENNAEVRAEGLHTTPLLSSASEAEVPHSSLRRRGLLCALLPVAGLIVVAVMTVGLREHTLPPVLASGARTSGPDVVGIYGSSGTGLSLAADALPELDAYGFPILSDVLPHNGSRVIWGICGPGRIAGDFTAALVAMGAKIGAVGAGSLPGGLERAADFARFYNIPRAYGSYLELARDPSVDVIYVATTNNNHYANTKLMLEHGKHVLLEKPATISPREFDELAALADARGLLLVTNFWSRWFPAVKWAKAVAHSGLLGDVVHLQGDMGFQAVRSQHGDRFSLASLGGGAMLDMGCYLVQFAILFLSQLGGGAPAAGVAAARSVDDFTVKAFGLIEGGVDKDVSFIIAAKAPNGSVAARSASYGTSLLRSSDFSLSIYCQHGKVELSGPANCPAHASYALFADAAAQDEPPVPCCGQPLLEERSFVQPLPVYPPALLGRRGYPNGMGFAYVASAFERCMYTPGCRELDELPMVEQRLIVELTAKVLRELGIYEEELGPPKV